MTKPTTHRLHSRSHHLVPIEASPSYLEPIVAIDRLSVAEGLETAGEITGITKDHVEHTTLAHAS
jgi:hypothetical protein